MLTWRRRWGGKAGDEVNEIQEILNGRVPSIRFETADDDVTFDRPAALVTVAETAPQISVAYGAVTGRVQTLSNRGALRFTLYDLVRDKAISCYLHALWAPSSPVTVADFYPLLAEQARDIVREGKKHRWRVTPIDAIHLATAMSLRGNELNIYYLKDFKRWSTFIGMPVTEPQAAQRSIPGIGPA